MRLLTNKQFLLENVVGNFEQRHKPGQYEKQQEVAWSMEWYGREEEWKIYLSEKEGARLLKEQDISKTYETLRRLVDEGAEPEQILAAWPEAPVLECCGERVDRVVIINEEKIEDWYDVSSKFCSKCLEDMKNLLDSN